MQKHTHINNIIHQNSDDVIHIARNAYQLTCLRKMIEEKEKKAYEILKLKSANEAAYFGDYFYNYTTRSGSIDYKKIPELKSVNLEDYRKDLVRVWKLDYRPQAALATIGQPEARYTEDGEVL